MERLPYRSDLSDARWALIEPVLTQWRAGRRGLGTSRPVHDLREIVNAIFYVTRIGIAWEYLPHDFPPAKTVYRSVRADPRPKQIAAPRRLPDAPPPAGPVANRMTSLLALVAEVPQTGLPLTALAARYA